MKGIPDFAPLAKTLDAMISAFNRLAAAIEDQNALTRAQMSPEYQWARLVEASEHGQNKARGARDG